MKTILPCFSSRRTAFSLIELLVVVAVIAILAGLLLAVSGYVHDRAARAVARTQIETLVSQLESYKAENGDYPKQSDGAGGLSTKVLLEALSPTEPGKKVYDIPVKMMNSFQKDASAAVIRATATFLVDPFGNPYHYQFSGAPDRSGKIFFDLWSQGKTNSSDPNLWVKNW